MDYSSFLELSDCCHGILAEKCIGCRFLRITHTFLECSFNFQAIKDIHLLGIVAALLAVDAVFLSVWFSVDPLKATKITFEDKVSVLYIYQVQPTYDTQQI